MICQSCHRRTRLWVQIESDLDQIAESVDSTFTLELVCLCYSCAPHRLADDQFRRVRAGEVVRLSDTAIAVRNYVVA